MHAFISRHEKGKVQVSDAQTELSPVALKGLVLPLPNCPPNCPLWFLKNWNNQLQRLSEQDGRTVSGGVDKIPPTLGGLWLWSQPRVPAVSWHSWQLCLAWPRWKLHLCPSGHANTWSVLSGLSRNQISTEQKNLWQDISVEKQGLISCWGDLSPSTWSCFGTGFISSFSR